MFSAFAIRLINDEQGTSAVEMGLICSLIIMAMFSALQSFAEESQALWTTVADNVASSNQAARGG